MVVSEPELLNSKQLCVGPQKLDRIHGVFVLGFGVCMAALPKVALVRRAINRDAGLIDTQPLGQVNFRPCGLTKIDHCSKWAINRLDRNLQTVLPLAAIFVQYPHKQSGSLAA